MFSEFGRNLQSKVSNPAGTIKSMVDLFGPLFGNVTETEEGRDVQLGDPATSDFADALTGASGLTDLLHGDVGVGNTLDLVGVGLDLGIPGPSLAPLLSTVFHGSSSNFLESILQKGLKADREIGKFGDTAADIAGSTPATFASDNFDIASGFADDAVGLPKAAGKGGDPVVLSFDETQVPHRTGSGARGQEELIFPEGVPLSALLEVIFPKGGATVRALQEAGATSVPHLSGDRFDARELIKLLSLL